MAAKDIVEAFEKEYYPMNFFSNQQCSKHFTNGWCAAKAAEVQKPSHNTGSPKLPTLLEAISGALGFEVSEFPNTDTGLAMKDMYDYMCRQLRAGA